MGTALRSKSKYGLVDQEITEKILPKFLDADAKELTLILLKVILDAKIVKEECDPKTAESAKEFVLDLLKAVSEPKTINREIIC